MHLEWKHLSIEETLAQLWQTILICIECNFVRKILDKCIICWKFNSPSYQYSDNSPLTPLPINSFKAFITVAIDNLGPVFVESIYSNEKGKTYKAWVTLYTCASSQAILLDLVWSMYSQTFIKSFKRFIYHRECPGNARSDNGKNFVSEETESFVHNLVVEWHVNLSLTLWHDSFFEYLVRSVKELLRKELKCYRLLYEEFQTVISEIEYFVNNQLITYCYSTDVKPCLTYSTINPVLEPQNLDSIVNDFWNRW